MIINTSQVELVLSDKAIPANFLEKETGVSKATVSRFRNPEKAMGIKSIGNITLDTAMKIQRWINDGNFKINYDYSGLIEELERDLAEGLTGEYIYIVRGEFNEALGACPIVDYYYNPGDIMEGDIAEKARTAAVLTEMKSFYLE
ncbi:hypothetical protein ACERC8_01265 [Streptococcus sp. E29BA]|uniref:hypothetical protein n=1 Tax=Streptococcus sp. E29BA TaxID=3278716 RepID=UPI00359ECF85